MRAVTVLAAFVLCVLTTGCAVVEQEAHNRGGYLDSLADDYWLKADSKKMRALRALAIEVSLARIASVSSKNDYDRRLLARRIGSTTERGKYVFMCAFKQNPLTSGKPEEDPCFYYDSLMVDYSTALSDLAMLALPIEDGQKLINSIGGSILSPANIGGVIESLVAIGKDAIKYGRVVGALYRDTQELEVQVWLASPDYDQSAVTAKNRIPEQYVVKAADVANLQLIYSRQNDDMGAWRKEIDALRARGLEPIPDKRFGLQLVKMISYLCDLITQDKDALKDCKADVDSGVFQASTDKGKMTASRKTSRMIASSFSDLRVTRPRRPLITGILGAASAPNTAPAE